MRHGREFEFHASRCAEASGIGDGGRALALAGHALRPEAVPELLERLRSEPAFVGLAFRTFRVEESEESGVLDFRIDSASEEETVR